MMMAQKEGNRLKVCLSGELDHCAAEGMRNSIERMLQDKSIRHLLFDFSQVTFMDSSGIGMIIGRYKTMMRRKGSVSACALREETERLFRMAGLHRIIAIEQENETDEK